MGLAVRVHRTRIPHVWAKTTSGGAVALRVGVNGISLFCIEHDFAGGSRRGAHGDSVFS